MSAPANWFAYTADHHVGQHPTHPYRAMRHTPDTDTAAVAAHLAHPAVIGASPAPSDRADFAPAAEPGRNPIALAHLSCRDTPAARPVKVAGPALQSVNAGVQGRIMVPAKDRKCGHTTHDPGG